MSPLNAAGADVIVNVALTLAPGATGSLIVAVAVFRPDTTAVQPFGITTLKSMPVTGAPVVFVNVTVVSCDDPGENVCRPGGVAAALAGLTLTRCTSYFAATTLACTF